MQGILLFSLPETPKGEKVLYTNEIKAVSTNEIERGIIFDGL